MTPAWILRAWWSALLGVTRAAWRVPVLNLAALAAFGILIPRRYGMDFLDIRLVLAYAFIPMLFVAPAVTNAMRAGSEARTSTAKLYTALSAIICYGWLVGIVVMALGLCTVNYIYRPPELLLPPDGVLPAYAIFCFAAVSGVAAFGAYVTLLFSPFIALNVLRLGFLGLLLFFYGGSSRLPLEWQSALSEAMSSSRFVATALTVSGILILFAAGLLRALRQSVPPARGE